MMTQELEGAVASEPAPGAPPSAAKREHRNEAYMDFDESVVSNVQNMLDEIDADMDLIDSVEN